MLVLVGTARGATFADGLAAFESGAFADAAAAWSPLAENGDSNAQYGLGRLYQRGLGVERDPLRACALYLKAAEAGHAGAQFSLGTLYDDGDGVVRDT